MASFFQDLRYAIRSFSQNPGFTLAAGLALALGIGAITPTFSLIDSFLLRPLPFSEPERLVHVWATEERKGLDKLRVSLPEYLDWKRGNDAFEDLALFNYSSEDLTQGNTPERISAGRVSANIFRVLGVQPLLGRGFLPDENQPGKTGSVVLSQRFWETRFGAADDILEKTLEVNGEVYSIVGVMPAKFVFPLPTTQLWLPHVLDEGRNTRKQPYFQVLGRLKPGVSQQQASQQMNALARRLAAEHPDTDSGRGVNLEPLRAALNFAYEIIQTTSVILLLANFFVLVIACANVSSLLVGRGLKRSRELAVRSALGASRGRLIRQLLIESLTLAAVGGALGLLLAFWIVDVASSTIPDDLYRPAALAVNGSALLFTLGVTVLSALMLGILPALTVSQVDLSLSLKEGAPSAGGARRGGRLQSILVVAETAVALALLIGTSLMIRSLVQLQQVDPGFSTDRVLTLKLILPELRYADATSVARFHEAVLENAASLPGAVSAATVNYLPLNHETNLSAYSVPGQPQPATGQIPTASVLSVSPGYLSVMGIPLAAGRWFDSTDRSDSAPVMVVNRVLAERLFPSEDAVSRLVSLEGRSEPLRIVGVVEPTRHMELTETPMAQVYLPTAQRPPRYFRLAVKTAGDPLEAAAAVREAVWSVDRDLPITEVRSMAEVFSDFLLPNRVISAFLVGLSAGAALLAAVGIYGLMAFFVSQKRREMGIRMAMGAGRTDVLRLVLGKGLALTLWGLFFGLPAGFALSRLLASQLFGISSLDWLTFTLVPALMVLVALLSCYLPARRASRVDPMAILRCE